MTSSVQAAEVIPITLGGAIQQNQQSGDQLYGVYVPTRFGGLLTIQTTDGEVTQLTGPNGLERTNGQEVGLDQQGWFIFKIVGAHKSYKVETKFVQVAQSTKKPWNFYYWPTKADSIHEPWSGGNGIVDADYSIIRGDDELIRSPGSAIQPGEDIVLAGPNGILETLPPPGDTATWFPNLYDEPTWTGPNQENIGLITTFQTPCPLLKYDQIYYTSARSWEAIHSQGKGVIRWPGHCLGGALASILLNEPVPTPDSKLTTDELKALWAELGENPINQRVGDYANEIPPGPPRPGPDECDWKVARVHAMLETHIRGARQALLGSMRAFPPNGTNGEVWNQGVYKYVAVYKATTGPLAVNIKMELHANSGSMLNGQDNQDRIILYDYNLTYGLNGIVDEISPADWISVGGDAFFAPLNILEIVEAHWQGYNPHVTETNVRALDLANGGHGQSALSSSRTLANNPKTEDPTPAPTEDLTSVHTPTQPESIHGMVVEAGVPRGGFTVYLLDPKTNEPEKCTTTRDDGSFAFTGITPGEYLLICQNPETKRLDRPSVTVEAGTITHTKLQLLLP